jgi:hypothetical protein
VKQNCACQAFGDFHLCLNSQLASPFWDKRQLTSGHRGYLLRVCKFADAPKKDAKVIGKRKVAANFGYVNLEGWMSFGHCSFPAPGERCVACAGKFMDIVDVLWECHRQKLKQEIFLGRQAARSFERPFNPVESFDARLCLVLRGQ